jgi:hypothetical protein
MRSVARRLLSTLLASASFAQGGAIAELRGADLPLPAATAANSQWGARIQRTMTLLATSTAKQHRRVRILFYGQSVTAGAWAGDVAQRLRKAYPFADLEIENRAIGGFSAPALIHTAESDLYPFYPDLMIFHVYGGDRTGELEQIIARTRQRTTAEILIRTPHFRWPKDLARDGSPDDPRARQLSDEDDRQAEKIRQIAAKYGCELADVRQEWRDHMQKSCLFPKDLLADSVHLNPAGNRLMASLVMRHLRYDAKFPQGPWKDLMHEFAADQAPVQRRAGGALELTFEGNRVDVLAAPIRGGPAGTARILLDGKPPSSYPELYYCTRSGQAPGVWWPAVNRIDFEKPRLVEKWVLRVLQSDPEGRRFTFEVVGSQTGNDGSGTSTERFVSRSGRVVIDPARWNVHGALRYRKAPMPADFRVEWEVRPLFADVYQPPQVGDPAREYATTLAQGLRNGRHTLQIIPHNNAPVPVRAICTYRPPLSE